MNRRDVMKNGILGTGAIFAGRALNAHPEKSSAIAGLLNERIHHSVCYWTFNHMTLNELCLLVKRLGFGAIDLVGPKEWHILKKHGIDSSMCNGAEISLVKGWNRPEHHETLINNYLEHIDLVSKAGYKNLICFSGNREGMDDETGLQHCVEGLQQILSAAEKKGVIIQMELFNSKVDHKDYMCDKSAWGIELFKRLDSPNFKLLYDIYHMQISEGDIMRTITENHKYFGHYHTAGVPGRNDIDETQELYYPAIMRTIFSTGYTGYVAHEFMSLDSSPEGKEKALKKAIEICDI